ncbi:MAG: glycosyltransferase, partial [Paraglaciecola sp.]|uniref:glycosyltransferase n=1 Tax=Paraglaciecola sp. TaxID=1920173 RepID=UPI003296B477
VFSQSFTSFKYFIIIDGDISDSILTFLIEKEKAEARLTLLRNPHNVGLSASMNKAIEVAKDFSPKYFFRMDSDDISFPERFALQVQFLEDNPRISILGSSLIEINEKGEQVGKRKLPVENADILKLLPKRCAINHPTVMLRFSIFQQGLRYTESLRNTQDYFFWAELAAKGYKFANLPEPLLSFRRVNNFYKRRGLSKSLNEFKARFYTMKVLKRYSIGNVFYAFAVLFLRLMPSKVVKLAYRIDRYFLNKSVKHE